jgi:hypothetical protein
MRLPEERLKNAYKVPLNRLGRALGITTQNSRTASKRTRIRRASGRASGTRSHGNQFGCPPPRSFMRRQDALHHPQASDGGPRCTLARLSAAETANGS